MEALEALKYSEVVYTEAHKKYECFFYEGELVVFYAKERYYFTDAEQQVAFKKVVLDRPHQKFVEAICKVTHDS